MSQGLVAPPDAAPELLDQVNGYTAFGWEGESETGDGRRVPARRSGPTFVHI